MDPTGDATSPGWQVCQHFSGEKLRIERVAAEEAPLRHSPSESQPLARFDRVALDGRRSSLVLRSKPQRVQSPIEGDLLEGVGQGLELAGVVDSARPLERPDRA